MENKVIVVKPKTLSPADKGKLSKGGYIVIEHENPNEVKFLTESDSLQIDIMLSAIDSLSESAPNTEFRKKLNAKLQERYKK